MGQVVVVDNLNAPNAPESISAKIGIGNFFF